jgi:leucyl aminopeptidase
LLVSSKVVDKDLLGIFENSLHLCNYENSHKKPYEEPEKDESKEADEEEEEKDPRTTRVNKKIDNINIVTEDKEAYESEHNKFQRVSAQATELARDLANTRGSVATPCFMEDAIRKLVGNHDKVKELRVVDEKQL